MTLGLSILRAGRPTRLKWHRLRRSLADPEFGAAVMEEGFRLGASMELDLRVRADGGFVVLHDADLARETTGQGAVAEHTGSDLRGITYRQSRAALILSEDLADRMPSAHPQALLQFDMKDDYARIGARGIDHLADLFGTSTAPIIFSGGCSDVIRALAERLPHLPRGIDPTDGLEEVARTRGMSATEAALEDALEAGAAPDTCYLNWELVLAAAAKGVDLIGQCHAHGVKVDAWTYTLADPAAGFSDGEWQEFHDLMALRPDQITTDEPLATERAWSARS